MKNIHELLTSWGKRERRMPARDEELKRKAFAAFAQFPKESPSGVRQSHWLSWSLAGLAIILLVINNGATNMPIPLAGVLSVPEKRGAVNFELSQAPSRLSIAPDYYPRPFPDQNIPITDTRELLKTDYNATIRTRSVQELTRRVATTVRGFGGRVDNASDSREWGYVSFVVPASKFDVFAREIESFVGARFIAIDTHSENLLPQKQSIEEQQIQIKKSIADALADRRKLTASHVNRASALTTQINTTEDALALLRAEQTTDPVRKTQIALGEQKLLAEQEALQGRIMNENASYAKQLNLLDEQLRNFDSSLQWVVTQDKNLLDTAATVHGTINVSWISIWEIVQLYVPVGWMAALLMVAAAISYLVDRRRYGVWM